MRKIQSWFVPAFLLLMITGNAQFKKGDRMVGASLGNLFYNSGSSDVSFPQGIRGYESKTNNYGVRIEPAFGWFISEKTVVGASLNINPSGQKITYSELGTTFQEDKTTQFNIGVGGFLRNYFGNNTASFMPWGQFGFNAGINSASSEGFKYYDSTPDYKLSYDGKSSGGFFANATLQFGMTKLLGDNVGLDIFAGYNFSHSKNTYKTTTTTDNAPYDGVPESTGTNEPTTKFTSHGAVIGIGFQVFLRNKSK